MITAHLTETEIQLYVAEPEAISRQLVTHLEDCALCRAKVANYVSLFKQIQEAPKPTFDFDLTALVLEQLPAPKMAFPWAAILISVLATALVAVSAVFFWSGIVVLIKGVSGVLLAVAATGAVVIVGFQAIELLKQHQKQMDTLLAQKTLQL
nr:hypothetical protein [Mucilaginibacter sp. L294]